MRVEIEREVARKSWKVYVLRDADNLWAMGPMGEWFEVAKGSVPERRGMAAADGGNLRLPTDQRPLADHLNDARQVRDRLLALVENGFNACVPDGKLSSQGD